MAERNLSLKPRVEAVREEKVIPVPIHFEPNEIYRHFEDSLNEIKQQYGIAQELINTGEEKSGKLLLRAQLALTEGLLDFYIHEISKFCLFQMFANQWDKTQKYGSILVPVIKVESAINSTDSKDWFFEFLNEKMSREVFLSVECMRDQLNLIGVGFVNMCVKAFPGKSQDESNKKGSAVVKELFERRNEIVHQNDRSHATAEQRDISIEYIECYIQNVESIVNAINEIVLDKINNQKDDVYEL